MFSVNSSSFIIVTLYIAHLIICSNIIDIDTNVVEREKYSVVCWLFPTGQSSKNHHPFNNTLFLHGYLYAYTLVMVVQQLVHNMIHIYGRYWFSPQSVFLSIFRRRKYAPFIFVFFFPSLPGFSLAPFNFKSRCWIIVFVPHRHTDGRYYKFAPSFCYTLYRIGLVHFFNRATHESVVRYDYNYIIT